MSITVGPNGPAYDHPPDSVREVHQELHDYLHATHQTLARMVAPGPAIPDATGPVSAADFNALLAALRAKGVIA
jgi:hypothetical protein